MPRPDLDDFIASILKFENDLSKVADATEVSQGTF